MGAHTSQPREPGLYPCTVCNSLVVPSFVADVVCLGELQSPKGEEPSILPSSESGACGV